MGLSLIHIYAGYDVVIVDNLYNASEKAVDRVKEITGKDLKFYQVDILSLIHILHPLLSQSVFRLLL